MGRRVKGNLARSLVCYWDLVLGVVCTVRRRWVPGSHYFNDGSPWNRNINRRLPITQQRKVN